MIFILFSQKIFCVSCNADFITKPLFLVTTNNKFLNMFQLRIGKDGRQIAPAKSANHFKEQTSASSTLTEVPFVNLEVPHQIDHFPIQKTLRDDLPFSIRINPGNIANSFPNKNYDIKQDFFKRVVESLGDLRKNISAYRLLEKDQTKAKQNINEWFHQAQDMFLGFTNGDFNWKEAQKIVGQELEKKRPLTPRQAVKQHHPSFLPNFYQQETQSLRIEVQTFRRSSMEQMKKISEISSLFSTLKGKYNAEKKANQTLNEAMEFYIEECDTLLAKISAKYQKEKAVTLLERQTQQVLTKLKFKTFNYHYRS